MSMISRIRERKIVQWALAYFAGGWVVLQLLDFLRENFGVPAALVRAGTVVIGVGFLGSLVVAWFHGRRGPQRVSTAEAVILVAIALGGAGLAFATFRAGDSETVAAIDEASLAQIAVLPFTNATGDASRDFYAEGVTRELIGLLADAGVRVLGFGAVASHSDAPFSPPLAEELGVGAIAIGRIIQSGDIVQIGVELLTRTGQTLWADVLSGDAVDVLSLQREIASEIAAGVEAELSLSRLEALDRAVQVDPTAYAEYLLGRQQMLRWTETGFDNSVQHFERAIEADPDFAPAHAALAVTYAYAVFYGWVAPSRARSVIESAASESIRLDPDSGEGYAARAWARLLIDWDFAGAETQLSQARELSRSLTTLYPLFLFYWYTGRFDEAGEVARELGAMEPNVVSFVSDYGWTRWSAGDTAAARVAAAAAIEMDPTFFEAHHLMAHVDLQTGRVEAARTNLNAARAVAGGDYHWRWALDGRIRVAEGDTAGARALLVEMGRQEAPMFGQRADLLFHIGAQDSAFVLLRRAVDTKDVDMLLYFRGHPSLEPWRSTAPFISLLREVGLEN